MPRILCFGDSNTYGFVPETMRRYDKNVRWCGVLQTLLGNEFEVVEAGCNNRTAFHENSSGIEFSGYLILPEYLDNSFDVIILALGINDVQKIYNTDYSDIEKGLLNLIALIKSLCPNIKILLVAPSRIKNNVTNHSYFSKLFDSESVKKSLWFSEIYSKVAEDTNSLFLDLDKITETSDVDGLHYSRESHLKIASEIYNLLKNYINFC